jgi:Methylamine utilisation protein MauE
MERSNELLKLHLIVQLAIGIVFLFSSGGKLWDYRRFTQGVAAYQIVPPSWANSSSLLIIAIETFLAAAHLTGFLMGVALLVGLGVLGIFGIAVSVNLKRGRVLPCYCFGVSDSTISQVTLIRLGLLATGELFLLRFYQPIHFLHVATPQLGFAAFWSIFLLVTIIWLFDLGDIVRLLGALRWKHTRA